MKQQTVHLFVFDTLADWEPGLAIAGLNNPAYQAQPGRYRVATVGVSRAPVVTVGGVTILPDLALDELTPEHSAMLILPGGGGWDQGRNTEVIDLTKRFLTRSEERRVGKECRSRWSPARDRKSTRLNSSH